jgi:beta-glucosidase
VTQPRLPAGFTLGLATAAYQIEGAAKEDGRGRSIWDTFSHTPGRVLNGDTGDLACDHYHRWQQDIELLKELGVGAYRFSVAWPRILPHGGTPVNELGLDWYERLVDGLLAAGIEPWLTLYHWDMPQPLEDAGGWPRRATADAFVEYTAVVARRLGDRVRHWITLNEPWCSAFLGYHTGEHAPGRRDLRHALQAAHTLLLAHGGAVRVLREHCPGASVGISLNPTEVQPATNQSADVAVARRYDGYLNRWFLDPIFGRGYPEDMLAHYADAFQSPASLADDLRSIASPLDFLGINYYSPTVVRADERDAFLRVLTVRPSREAVTEMGWIVRPSSLGALLRRVANDYPVRELVITENGAAYADSSPIHGHLDDPERIAYLAEHLSAAAEAVDAGVPLTGYFAWSFMDNFEWAWGYSRRFGLVHVDFPTQVRTPKQSAHWYRDFIAASR